MKKIIVLLVVAGYYSTTIAQHSRIGFQGGLNYAGTTGGVPDGGKVNFIPCIAAGVLINFDWKKDISFQPAISYVQKGTELVTQNQLFEMSYNKERIKLNYVEFAFNFLYRSGNGFFEGVGPVLSWGVSGDYYNEYKNGNETLQIEKRKIKFGNKNSDADLTRAEVGINAIGGIEFKNGVFLAVNFNYGITHSMTNRNSLYFGFRIGYMIK